MMTRIFPFLLIILLALGCSEPVENYEEVVIYEDSLTYEDRKASIIESVSLEAADGLQVSLWATDSLAPDPIAMSIDDYGNIYLTRTNRQKNSEFDIRGHRDWMTASISLQTVEDRRAFLHETFDSTKSTENEWLQDLNEDGLHDWRDLAVEKDEVWKLEDIDSDGVAEKSTRVLRDFNEEISDVAGALLVRRNDMFVGIGPDMWRITDRNEDGKWDTKESISHGYAVHIGFGGHGMSGAVEGPDGKIYWGIGDIGANIVTSDGRHFKYPNQGVLVRSNPDGSDFEVFAAGLRNVHEFTFDEYGNIIGADNDGDHPGESERLVYIVQGSDAGWRSNWQYGKYTDPDNNRYNVWMDEELYKPRWDGQAAYIIPPIRNYHNGPTGMIYNPGTALSSRWKNKFFLVEFVGNPSRSPIWSFSLKPSGASFELEEEEMVLKGILPTGIRFGPDGALYAADWINGWNTKNYGRVWKIDVENSDLAEERQRTEELILLNYEDQSDSELYDLLFYPDMRIRKKAQFELATRRRSGLDVFRRAVEQKENQLARVHGIWGIGQLIRQDNADGDELMPYLDDTDDEIVAQTAKLLGDVRYEPAGEKLVGLLNASDYRTRFFAAEALGRIAYEPAIPNLIDLLERNNDEDVYIRHAAVLALSRIGASDEAAALANNPSRALRLAGVLILRRLGDPRVQEFLNDTDNYIVTEAARAINDDWSIEEALPALAKMLDKEGLTGEPLIRRAISAASRLGGDEQVDRLLRFIGNDTIDAALRAEALSTLTQWGSPSVLDRVDGRNRGVIVRDSSYVIASIEPVLDELLSGNEDLLITSAAQAISKYGISSLSGQQLSLLRNHPNPAVRAAMVESLGDIDYSDMNEVLIAGTRDSSPEVRAAALSLIGQVEMDPDTFQDIVNPVFRIGTVSEQQEVLKVMQTRPPEEVSPILTDLVDKWKNDQLQDGIALELFDAVDSSKNEELIATLEPYRQQGNTTEDYMDAMFGGNRQNGARLFQNHPAAQCTRCHTWNEEPGSVGPPMRGIADRLSRRQILEALIEPSARIAPGYGSVTLQLKDGSQVSGILLEETNSEIFLRTNQAEPLKVERGRIEEIRNNPSSMPPMGMIMSKREIRDLVEFLSSLGSD